MNATMSQATRLHDVQGFLQNGGVRPVRFGRPDEPALFIKDLQGGRDGVLERSVKADVRHPAGFNVDHAGGLGGQQKRPGGVG